MQDFFKKMIKSPIKINNYKMKHMTTREELFANSSDKIIDKKGFSFKSFKTDKERLKSYIQNKEIKYDNGGVRGENKKLKKIFLEVNDDFKNKNDIKKLFHVFTHNHNDELDDEERLFYEKLRYNQLIMNDINNYDKYEDDNYNIFYNKNDVLKIINNPSLKEEDKYKKLLHNKIYNERKHFLFLRKLKLKHLNKLKKLNKTNSNFFPKKTNFKAIENLSLFKSPIIKHKINKTLSSNEINKEDNCNRKNIYNKTTSQFLKFRKIQRDSDDNIRKYTLEMNLEDIKNHSKNFLKIFSSKNPLDDVSLRKEIVGINPLLFQYNMNYIKNVNKRIGRDISSEDKIISLRKMAFEKKKKNDALKYENSFLKMIKQNEDMLIEGQIFKNTNIDKLANKLLRKCNWKPEIIKTKEKNII